MKNKWVIYWVAENEESLFLLNVILIMLTVGGIAFGYYVLGISSLVIFIALLFIIDACVKYKIKSSRNIKQ